MKKLTLQETLELNKAQRREEFYRIKKEQTKQRNKEIVLATFIGAFIVVTTIMFLINSTNKAIEKCVEAGHDKTYCSIKLS